jgi:membrane dipeptidase
MMATRRELLIGAAALAASTAARAGAAKTTAFSDQDYRRAIVIDGLGGVDDPYSPQDATVLDPRAVADLKASGLTMSHLTVNTVGNAADVWEKTIVTIAQIDLWITDNPEVFIKVSTTADIRRAKREGKSAVLYGTQDTSLVGADLDRLALLRGLGVRSVQLTYNLRNLSATARSSPAMLDSLGSVTRPSLGSRRKKCWWISATVDNVRSRRALLQPRARPSSATPDAARCTTILATFGTPR